MSDHGIHLPFKHQGPKPNTAEIRRQFSARRRSLSPSRFDDTAFDDFVLISESVSESSVMAKVIPILAGNANIPNEHNLQFTNCATLTGDLIVNPAPDFFDGAPPGALHKSLRDDLDRLVVPTKHGNGPVAPNLFLEGKSRNGSPLIARRQACLDGAYGARAMHSLQNYREEVQTYTAEVHAYSSTYCDGHLKLYSHQVTAPRESGGEPEYCMTQISCYALTDDQSAFVAGATAFRNARDMAQRHRDELIQSANAKARRANPPLFDDEPAAAGQREAGSNEPVDGAERLASDAPAAEHSTSTRQADESPVDGDELAHDPGPDDVEPTTSLATSATPVNGQLNSARSKRNRVSGSPPSETHLHKK